ncbi:MAG: serine protease [Phycisphaerae bacterium]|nr:serine protease [Phycisphaerae bacterium]
MRKICHYIMRNSVILHSPVGSAEAAEALVQYLRSKFAHIRVIVPQSAMSAATMMACAADAILMGKHSFLGPIDPQLFINTSLGGRMVAAQAILEQFNRAKSECTQPENMGAWLPMLSQYGPDLLVTCKNACDLSRDLVQGWLEKYMFSAYLDRVDKAARIAEWLSTHSNFKSHGRHIGRTEARSRGLNIEDLETNQTVQDAVLSVFHATTHTFSMTGAVKIIENQLGKAFIKTAQVFLPGPPISPGPQPPAPS